MSHYHCILPNVSEFYCLAPYNKSSLWKCEDCGYVDTQSHILNCPAYQELREGKSLNCDADLVTYFAEVLKLREGSSKNDNDYY